MRIRLLAVGQKMPDWVTTGYLDYAKRLQDDVRLELVEIPAAKRTKNSDVDKMKAQEGDALLAAIHPNERVIALEAVSEFTFYSRFSLKRARIIALYVAYHSVICCRKFNSLFLVVQRIMPRCKYHPRASNLW